jgi:hypothetical protein
MFEWWHDQSPWLRYGIALLILGIEAVEWFAVGRVRPVVVGIGVALLLLSGPSDSEKKGYRF